MLFWGLKKIKISLVLLTFFGFIFGLSCAVSHPEVSVHSTVLEDGTFFAQANETCCGTNISEYQSLLGGEFFVAPKETNNSFVYLLTLGLLVFSIFFERYFLDGLVRQLSTRQRRYTRVNQFTFFLDYLILSFSRGILNPKKYNLSFSN